PKPRGRPLWTAGVLGHIQQRICAGVAISGPLGIFHVVYPALVVDDKLVWVNALLRRRQNNLPYARPAFPHRACGWLPAVEGAHQRNLAHARLVAIERHCVWRKARRQRQPGQRTAPPAQRHGHGPRSVSFLKRSRARSVLRNLLSSRSEATANRHSATASLCTQVCGRIGAATQMAGAMMSGLSVPLTPRP